MNQSEIRRRRNMAALFRAHGRLYGRRVLEEEQRQNTETRDRRLAMIFLDDGTGQVSN